MFQYECSYQDATGPSQIKNLLDNRISPSILSQIQQFVGDNRVGVMEVLNPTMDISSAFLRAKQLAENRNMNQIVIFDSSYFAIEPNGKVSGPLASRCSPNAESAQMWAKSAIEFGDATLLAKVNGLLPERPCTSLKNEKIIMLAIERAVKEFSGSILLPGMIVGRYLPGIPMHREFLENDDRYHRAGEIIEITDKGALVRFSVDPSVEPIEVPRDQLYDATRIMAIIIEIDQTEKPGWN